MKNQVFIILLFVSINGLSQCPVPTELRNAYEFDVGQLALDRINEVNSIYKDSIAIPYLYKDTVWDGLAAIYEMTNTPEKDSIYDIYCVHKDDCWSGQFIPFLVEVDSQATWIPNWENNIIQTGIPALDYLFDTYDFSLVDYNSISNTAYFESPTFINMIAFRDSLLTFTDIIDAYVLGAPQMCCHNEIHYTRNPNTSYITFIVQWDGTNGGMCKNQHIYYFEVDNQCNPALVGTHYYHGSSPNAPVSNCNISSQKSAIKEKSTSYVLYPNPSDDYISISSESNAITSFIVFDAFGNICLQGIFCRETTINISNFSNGIYLISLYDDKEGNVKNLKFIKG